MLTIVQFNAYFKFLSAIDLRSSTILESYTDLTNMLGPAIFVRLFLRYNRKYVRSVIVEFDCNFNLISLI